ncbi:hypothetical protein FGO68_gene14768 [Halteria grandinella]|uniref:Uncharacterized protein n=1 Tax=Halteria grandinella TaxID=5974 RepID=A0A8J8NYV8_HALGN|nr:hypothetical protein FGO68_gene14768 [Halteria grandinella]
MLSLAQPPSSAKFRLGKLVNKNLIVSVLATSHFSEEIQALLYSLNKCLRLLIIENLKLLKDIPSCVEQQYIDVSDIDGLFDKRKEYYLEQSMTEGGYQKLELKVRLPIMGKISQNQRKQYKIDFTVGNALQLKAVASIIIERASALLSTSKLCLIKDTLNLDLTKWEPKDQIEEGFQLLDIVLKHVSTIQVNCCPNSCELIKYLSERHLQRVDLISITQEKEDYREDYQFSEDFYQVLQRVPSRTSILMRVRQIFLVTQVFNNTKDIESFSFTILDNNKKRESEKERKSGDKEEYSLTQITERDIQYLAQSIVGRRFNYQSLSLTFQHMSTTFIKMIVDAQNHVKALHPLKNLNLSVSSYDEDFFSAQSQFLKKSINASSLEYKQPSGKYLRDYFTKIDCTNRSINLDKYPDLSDENIIQYLDMLDFLDERTRHFRFQAKNIENYSILIIKLIQNCNALETFGVFSRFESLKYTHKNTIIAREFEFQKDISKSLKDICILGELSPDGNAFMKAILSSCKNTITKLQLLFDTDLASSYLTHANSSLIQEIEINDLDDAMYEYLKCMKNLKSFQTTHYGCYEGGSEEWKDVDQHMRDEEATIEPESCQQIALLAISGQENQHVKSTKQMINLLRSWPQLEKFQYFWDYDFSSEISKLKNLQYLQPSGKHAFQTIEQLIKACQNKSSSFEIHNYAHSIKMGEVLQLRNSITNCIIHSEVNLKHYLNQNEGVNRDQLLETILRELFVPL